MRSALRLAPGKGCEGAGHERGGVTGDGGGPDQAAAGRGGARSASRRRSIQRWATSAATSAQRRCGTRERWRLRASAD